MENPTARETNATGGLSSLGPGGAARRLWGVYGGYALGFVSLFLIWQLASLYVVGSVLFPPPTVVFSKGLLLVRNGVLLEHLAASMQRILAGFIAGDGCLHPHRDAPGDGQFLHHHRGGGADRRQ